jgi:hypothetical protein
MISEQLLQLRQSLGLCPCFDIRSFTVRRTVYYYCITCNGEKMIDATEEYVRGNKKIRVIKNDIWDNYINTSRKLYESFQSTSGNR